jgi:hypothetical protein
MKNLNQTKIVKLMKFEGEADYKKLKTLPFNRNFHYRLDLASSMNKYGWLGAIGIIMTDVVTGKMEMYIYDGQHRAITALQLGIPFYGIVETVTFEGIANTVQFVADQNTTQHKWYPTDYVNAFCYLNFEDYKYLVATRAKCPYTLTAVAGMLTGFRGRGIVADILQNGTFKVLLKEETNYTLSLAARLSKYGKMSSRMAMALHYVSSLKSFNEEKFEIKYAANYKCIKELRLDDYTDIFSTWL